MRHKCVYQLKKFAKFFYFIIFNSYSQVSGVVKDGNSRERLVGARVEIMGGGPKTACDVNGEFSLEVSEFPAWVKCSISGYMPDSIQINSAQVLHGLKRKFLLCRCCIV